MSETPGYEIDIRVEENCWPYPDGILDVVAENALASICKHIDTRPFSEVSIAMITNGQMQALNKQYRGKDKPTNVLSFPASLDGSCPLLGDIVLAFKVAEQEAVAKNITMTDHVSHLLIHGFLHLLGYDHETDADAQVMETLEIKALAGLGISNPYVMDRAL